MLCIEIRKPADYVIEDPKYLLRDVKRIMDIVEPWFRSNKVFCADSLFSSAQAPESLLERSPWYITVVKTAMKIYFMKSFSQREVKKCLEHFSLVSKT